MERDFEKTKTIVMDVCKECDEVNPTCCECGDYLEEEEYYYCNVFNHFCKDCFKKEKTTKGEL